MTQADEPQPIVAKKETPSSDAGARHAGGDPDCGHSGLGTGRARQVQHHPGRGTSRGERRHALSILPQLGRADPGDRSDRAGFQLEIDRASVRADSQARTGACGGRRIAGRLFPGCRVAARASGPPAIRPIPGGLWLDRCQDFLRHLGGQIEDQVQLSKEATFVLTRAVFGVVRSILLERERFRGQPTWRSSWCC